MKHVIRSVKSFPMHIILFTCLIVFKLQPGLAQEDPALWTFTVTSSNGHQATLNIEVRLPPGWHIYSQFLKEGGPMPTQFHVAPNPDVILIGQMTESGNASSFYDELFEMDIVWYKDRALFSQPLTLHRPATTIKGKVEYMVCNDIICIPANRTFSINVSPTN